MLVILLKATCVTTAIAVTASPCFFCKGNLPLHLPVMHFWSSPTKLKSKFLSSQRKMLWLTLKFSFIYSFHPYYTVSWLYFHTQMKTCSLKLCCVTFTAISSLDWDLPVSPKELLINVLVYPSLIPFSKVYQNGQWNVCIFEKSPQMFLILKTIY